MRSGMWCVKCGVWSADCKVRRAECKVRSVKFVKTVECGVCKL